MKGAIQMRKLLAILLLLGAVLTLTSCKMLKGAGEDIEDAGDAVQDATN
jgi:predicted small secreted protein